MLDDRTLQGHGDERPRDVVGAFPPQGTDEARPGATPESWQHFSEVLGLTADLLPVVADTSLPISPGSTLKSLGKIPSLVNARGHVVGITAWPQRRSTAEDIQLWALDGRLGICLQTRSARAIDVDIDDVTAAAAVREAVERRLGRQPTRGRENSAKFLVLVRCEGDIGKRVIRTVHGAIELLGTGQHCVIGGTHPSGVRYEWEGGLPAEILTVPREELEALWRELADRFAVAPPVERTDVNKAQTLGSKKASVLAQAAERDPIARHLAERGFVKSSDPSTGALNIECPFSDEHTQDSSETATRYFPANTGGYDPGNFKCMHAHCAGRSRADFLAAIGFEDITARAADPTRFFAYNPDVLRAQEYVIDGCLPIGLTNIAGGPGVGKTSLLVPLASAAAHLYKSTITPELRRKVIYVAEAPEQVARILYGLRRHADDPRPAAEFAEWFRIAPARRLPPAEIGDLISAWVSAFTVEQAGYAVGPLIVLDTSNATIDLENENDNAEVGRAISAIKESMGNAGVWVIAHTPKNLKPDSSPAELTARGASAFAGDSNATAFIFEDPNRPDVRILATRKVRVEPSLRELQFCSHVERQITTTPWGTEQEVVYRFGIPEPSSPHARETASAFAREALEEATKTELEARIRTHVLAHAPVTKESITKAMGRKAKFVRDRVKEMISRGELVEAVKIRGHARYRLRPGAEDGDGISNGDTDGLLV